jgi:hypothetical protein
VQILWFFRHSLCKKKPILSEKPGEFTEFPIFPGFFKIFHETGCHWHDPAYFPRLPSVIRTAMRALRVLALLALAALPLARASGTVHIHTQIILH